MQKQNIKLFVAARKITKVIKNKFLFVKFDKIKFGQILTLFQFIKLSKKASKEINYNRICLSRHLKENKKKWQLRQTTD